MGIACEAVVANGDTRELSDDDRSLDSPECPLLGPEIGIADILDEN